MKLIALNIEVDLNNEKYINILTHSLYNVKLPITNNQQQKVKK